MSIVIYIVLAIVLSIAFFFATKNYLKKRDVGALLPMAVCGIAQMATMFLLCWKLIELIQA